MTVWVVVTASILNLTASVTYVGTYATSGEAQTAAASRIGASILPITLPPLAMAAASTAG